MIDLSGKSIVVTGAGGGLGRAYAHALAERGGRIIVNDISEIAARSVVAEIRDNGGEAHACAGSVASWSDTEAMVQSCVERFGKIDGLVNNAAIYHSDAWTQETEQRLRAIVDVNVLGTMFSSVHALRLMKHQGFGRIVNVTSGAHIGLREMSAYGATKGAVASLTYNLALEVANSGVSVNAVSPLARTAMGNPVTNATLPAPEAIAPIIVFLMSDGAGHLNGRVLRYDGDALTFLDPPAYAGLRISDDISTPEGIERALVRYAASDFGSLGMIHD